MTDKRRMMQLLHVRGTLTDLADVGKDISKVKFKKLKTLLVKSSLVMSGVSPERYTAMLLSYYRSNTTDEDVLWHA